MSLTLVIAINVVADSALLGGLAFVMSRAARLTPHVSATHAVEAGQQVASPPRQPRLRAASRRQVGGSRGAIAHQDGARAATTPGAGRPAPLGGLAHRT